MENPTEIVRLLVVSHEMAALRPLWSIVESNRWRLETAGSGWEALERVQSGLAPHLVILDVAREDRDLLHVLRWFRRLRPELPLVLLCYSLDAGTKNDAIRLGADDVLVRPFPDKQLESVIRRFLSGPRVVPEGEMVSENIDALGAGHFFISASPLTQKLHTQAELLAQGDFPVLVLGEKGSGKATTARLIHSLSIRSGFKFSIVNCTAMPADLLETELFGAVNMTSEGHSSVVNGKLETVAKGTILLHEVTAMPNALQAQLLEVLQDGHYVRWGSEEKLETEARILASTSANIERALSEKKLREDLYYRLSAFTVHVSPLRQRKEEIRALLRHFMHRLAKHYGLPAREFSQLTVEACQNYSWPGNLTELETFVKRYLIAGENRADLHPGFRPGAGTGGLRSEAHLMELTYDELDSPEEGPRSLKAMVQNVKCEAERNAIGQALEKTGWNRKAAARLLRVSYRTLLYKIEHYHMTSAESFLSPLSAPAQSALKEK